MTTLEEQQVPTHHRKWGQHEQPLLLILQTFSALSEQDEDFWQRSVPYFERKEFDAGDILYQSDDPADGFYLLETGILKAQYLLPQGSFTEVIVAGSTCGELPFFSDTKRTSMVLAERESVAWVLRPGRWTEMQRKEPDIAHELLKITLKLTSERMDVITK